MGVPYYGRDMTSHPQYMTVRNARGAEMLDLVRDKLELLPTQSSGDRRPFVLQTVAADDECVISHITMWAHALATTCPLL